MKDSLKDKLNKVKTTVKKTFDQSTSEEKPQANKGIKDRKVSGVSEQQKQGYRQSDKI